MHLLARVSAFVLALGMLGCASSGPAMRAMPHPQREGRDEASAAQPSVGLDLEERHATWDGFPAISSDGKVVVDVRDWSTSEWCGNAVLVATSVEDLAQVASFTLSESCMSGTPEGDAHAARDFERAKPVVAQARAFLAAKTWRPLVAKGWSAAFEGSDLVVLNETKVVLIAPHPEWTREDSPPCPEDGAWTEACDCQWWVELDGLHVDPPTKLVWFYWRVTAGGGMGNYCGPEAWASATARLP